MGGQFAIPNPRSKRWSDLPGFDAQPMTVAVRNSDELKVDAKLYVGTVGTIVEAIPPALHAGERPLPVIDPSERVAILPPLARHFI